jgi:hypothetical protein
MPEANAVSALHYWSGVFIKWRLTAPWVCIWYGVCIELSWTVMEGGKGTNSPRLEARIKKDSCPVLNCSVYQLTLSMIGSGKLSEGGVVSEGLKTLIQLFHVQAKSLVHILKCSNIIFRGVVISELLNLCFCSLCTHIWSTCFESAPKP